jgi:hypothetical protein
LALKLSLVPVVLAVLLLAGCNSGSGLHINKQYQGVGKVADKPSFDGTTQSVIYWLDKHKNNVALTTWGSGSCPDVPVGLRIVSSTKVELAIKDNSGPCTSDLAPYTSEFAVPAGVSRKSPISISLNVPGRSAPEMITLGVTPGQGPASQ